MCAAVAAATGHRRLLRARAARARWLSKKRRLVHARHLYACRNNAIMLVYVCMHVPHSALFVGTKCCSDAGWRIQTDAGLGEVLEPPLERMLGLSSCGEWERGLLKRVWAQRGAVCDWRVDCARPREPRRGVHCVRSRSIPPRTACVGHARYTLAPLTFQLFGSRCARAVQVRGCGLSWNCGNGFLGPNNERNHPRVIPMGPYLEGTLALLPWALIWNEH